MQTPRFFFFLAFCLGLGACQAPPENALFSPDRQHWLQMQSVPADPAKEQLLPTQRLVLGPSLVSRPLVLMEDMENLCGVNTVWTGPLSLQLRVPLAVEKKVLVHDGQTWDGVTLSVSFHRQAILFERPSSDGARRLVVIANCQQTLWNLYLRRGQEALYNDAMANGWDDPDVFGGFAWDQSVLSLEWIGAREARVVVDGGRYGVTVREKVGDVRLHWVFTNKGLHK